MIHISRGVRIRFSSNTLIIATTMAAFRRLASIVNRLNVWSAPRNELLGAQTTTGGRTRRCLAVGTCLATGGAVAFYFYNDMYSQRCRKRMGYSFSGRDLLPSLFAVAAQQKAQPFDFEEGDVYMSSHEQRFRLFSSVEYEGQLYMTPQNFIESVTMSEPRSIIQGKNFSGERRGEERRGEERRGEERRGEERRGEERRGEERRGEVIEVEV
ncbi:unnamed protein product [Coregonus sp. 'balchen']|nr:unnamed protein product [Coregonus sp. 'balchen']